MVDLLAAAGHQIVAWRRPGGRPPLTTARASWQEVDLLDRRAVSDAIERACPTMVYHCAGAAHVGRSWEATESTFAINVMGTHHLLEALARARLLSAVLLPSSSMVYRPADRPIREDDALVPPSPYGLSKLAQELLGQHAASSHLSVMIGRAFNHVGPRQDPSFAASGFARQIAEIEAGLRAPEVLVGNLDTRRDTIDVRDTVRAYQVILERGRPGRPYNVSAGRAVATGDVLEMLAARATARIAVRVDQSRFRPNDAPVTIGDSSRLRDELGWSPQIPLAATLEDLLTFWRSTLRGERPITTSAP
jgi:GDP-4-dehydro-6-deoxy-D-mannose reductase